MRQIRIALIASLILLSTGIASSQEFTVTSQDGRKLHFNITDQEAGTVELSRDLTTGKCATVSPTSVLNIPVAAAYEGKAYKVTAIGEKALAGSEDIQTIILPSTVKSISSAAFEDCIRLESVIMPGSNTRIAEDAFDGCTALSNISFGSDWTYIDFSAFKNCTAYEEVKIPAKVSRIDGITELAAARTIEVESANPYFTSVSGLLYDRTDAELIYCPALYGSKVVIPEGTKNIRRGALAHCKDLKEVILPASMVSVSYDEFAMLSHLESISINSKKVTATGILDGRDVFALEVNPDVKIYVNRKSVKTFRSQIENRDGIYETLDGTVRKSMEENSLAKAGQIKKAKRSIG